MPTHASYGGSVPEGLLLCDRCVLSESRIQVVPGSGPECPRVLVVGEAPGRTEDEGGQPFSGASGKVLDEFLHAAGLKREEVYITSVLKCRPPKNRNPRREEIAACAPWLIAQIDALKPEVIVTLGIFGTEFFLHEKHAMGEVQGRPVARDGRLILPVYHPAATLYNRKLSGEYMRAAETLAALLAGEEMSAGEARP